MEKSLLQIIICFILSIVVYPSIAQKSGNYQEVKYGFRAGLNLSNMSGITDFSSNMKAGYSLGFLINFSNKRISSTQEVLFSNKGFTFQLANGGTFIYSIDYIDIPWYVNYHILDNFTVYGGAQISILVDASTNKPIPNENQTSYARDGLSNLDLGFVVGTEYTLPSRIFFGLRFTRGIYSAFSDNNSKYNNYNFMLSAGYYFFRKKGNVFD
jgi:hypothetical protein